MRFDKKEYDKQYEKDHYFRMSLVLPKEYRRKIENASKEQGLSKNAFIRQAIDKELL